MYAASRLFKYTNNLLIAVKTTNPQDGFPEGRLSKLKNTLKITGYYPRRKGIYIMRDKKMNAINPFPAYACIPWNASLHSAYPWLWLLCICNPYIPLLQWRNRSLFGKRSS